MMKYIVYLLFLLQLPFIGLCQYTSQRLIVEVENGLVQGYKMSENLYGFRGIPYAKPPINELRFEPPQKPDSWEKIWNATYDRSECIQTEASLEVSAATPGGFRGNEDCLYINVYTPLEPQTDVLLPVMVWIYGGTFLAGSGSYRNYAPDDLVKQGVIVVTFNYRLGIFGFLSTDDDAAPGNIGLKDQIFALKWVQNNIKAFGGDPSNVIIFGESAGAASVSYLILSPLSKGLFTGGIMQSGTALCLWSLSRVARQAAFQIGLSLNIQTNDSEVLVNDLKSIKSIDLLRASQVIMSTILLQNPLAGLVYSPVIEHYSKIAVITKASYTLLTRGHFNRVPTIIGYNSAEAESFAELMSMFYSYMLKFQIEPFQLVPINMNLDENTLPEVVEKIGNYYAGKDNQLIFPSENFILYMSDDQFIRPIQKTAVLMSKYAKVYLYKFSYTSDPNATGAAHADDLKFLFQSNSNTLSDKRVRQCMIQLWTNFAKYRNPTATSRICSGRQDWKPLPPNHRKGRYYINIDRKTATGKNPDQDDFNFWENLYTVYGKPPYDTY